MKRFVPLIETEHGLIETIDAIDSNLWDDAEFLSAFQKNLDRNFEVIRVPVTISGAEFKKCAVFRPIGQRKDYHYTLFDDEFGPIDPAIESHPSAVERFSNADRSLTPAPESIDALLDESAYSDKFYNELYTVLSSDYVLPACSLDGEETHELYSTSELLSHSRLLVLGAAGTGKTSLVRKLAFDCGARIRNERSEKTPIPIYIRLRDISYNKKLISNAVEEKKQKIGINFIQEKSYVGDILYIFDGLDELESDSRKEFRSWLSEFEKEQSACRIIITSRNIEKNFGASFQKFKKLNIAPFTKSKQLEFCLKTLHNKRRANSFFSYIEDNSELQSFLSNPLSLALAIALFSVRGVLPFNIGNLVSEIVEHFTKHWDEKRQIHRYEVLKSQAVTRYLSQLATKLQVLGQTTFEPDFSSDLLPIEVENRPPEEILEYVKFTTSLLTERDGRWAFSHAYFQDFFCANLIVERIGGIGDEFGKFSDDKLWVNVWRQLGQLCTDPQDFAHLLGDAPLSSLTSLDLKLVSFIAQSGVGRATLTELSESLVTQSLSLGELIQKVEPYGDGYRIEFSEPFDDISDAFVSCIRSLSYLKETPNYGVLMSAIKQFKEHPLLMLFAEIAASSHGFDVRAEGRQSARVWRKKA